jgi:site-specific recombinase XerD
MLENQHILYSLPKGKINKKGETPIYCRITINGERVTFSTQRYIAPKKWDAVNQKVINRYDESKTINPHLNLLTNKIYEAHFKLESSGDKVTALALKHLVLGEKHKNSKSLFDVFEEHNKKMSSLINLEYAVGTAKRYETTLKHLQDFVKWKYKQTDFKIRNVNHEFVHELDYYMRSVRKCSNNTTVKYVKNFRKIIKLALANSWMDKDPFANYVMKIKKVDRGYLTLQELTAIMQKNFTVKRLEQVRDVFVFQCYTGLAYCDTFKLTHANIIKDDNGVLWIKAKRIKTDTPINVPVLPIAAELIKKYKYATEDTGKLLPVLSNQKMNAYLKEIADLCNIEKRLSCHLARHTFATTVTLANGISLESVSKMLGHTNLVTTKIYARMLDSRVLSEMQMLSSKLKPD